MEYLAGAVALVVPYWFRPSPICHCVAYERGLELLARQLDRCGPENFATTTSWFSTSIFIVLALIVAGSVCFYFGRRRRASVDLGRLGRST
eukprot:1613305-Amphidinium_carterae.1